MQTTIALLRGINVGGNNIIRMADLRSCFLEMGLQDVQTYIQSGNVVFNHHEYVDETFKERLRVQLETRFDYRLPVMLRSLSDLEDVVSEAPPGFGTSYESHKYDVLFLNPPLTATEALPEIPVNDPVDTAWPGPGVVYYRRSPEHLTKSGLNKLPSRPVYQKLTIRNWRTTTRLLEMGRQLASK